MFFRRPASVRFADVTMTQLSARLRAIARYTFACRWGIHTTLHVAVLFLRGQRDTVDGALLVMSRTPQPLFRASIAKVVNRLIVRSSRKGEQIMICA